MVCSAVPRALSAHQGAVSCAVADRTSFSIGFVCDRLSAQERDFVVLSAKRRRRRPEIVSAAMEDRAPPPASADPDELH